ncbi:MAG: ABC transporter permease [Lachnospiraceae bacterium]|nr:ABC transporter permease [Lachnospiraceae bacterium]
MYFKLAFRNVKRQLGNYMIYFITVALTVALLFAVNNIIYSRNLAVFVDRGESAKTTLQIIVVMISMVVAFVLSYATSFLLKRRKREFGTYLTLGMTRRDLLTIFLVETLLICLIALGAGLAAGSFLFQGLMAVMMKLLEMRFAIAAYSAEGFSRTILLTVGIFLTASIASAVYLKSVSIYDLIHGEKKVEKGVRHPVCWFSLTFVSLAGMLACGGLFFREMDKVLSGGAKLEDAGILLSGFILSVVGFHAGLAKSMVALFLRLPGFRSRGSNTFVLRQLSGSLSANALMFGALALLMTFAVVGTNFSFIQKAGQEEALLSEYPYDIMYYSNKYERGEEFPLEAAEAVIEKYAGIKKRIPYRIFETGRQDFYSRTKWYEEWMAPGDSFMPVSDFNAVMAPLGVEPVSLEGQYMIVGNNPIVGESDWSDMVYEWGGKSYTYHSCRLDYPKISYLYFYVVVPDEAVQGMECVEQSVAYLTEQNRFDGMALEQALRQVIYVFPDGGLEGMEEADGRLEFEIREYHRQEENNVSAILVVGALFVSAVFLLLAMAILALKTLSTLGEDRQRYEICFRLGMGEREQCRALFRQTFSFFLLPFVLPCVMSIPVAWFGRHVLRIARMEAAADTVPLITGIVAAGMAVLYLLYYTAAYLIAKRTVVRGG